MFVSYPKPTNTDLIDARLQADLDTLSKVAGSWNLEINTDKCVVMRFGTRASSACSSGYTLCGKNLRLVNEHRDLGVTVDSTLKFHKHINVTINKASALSNQLLRCTVNRNASFMVPLYISHIRPLIEYCSSVWNLGYLGDVRRLESVQRGWTRQIAGLEGLDYVARLKRLDLFSISGRLLRADLIKIWQDFPF